MMVVACDSGTAAGRAGAVGAGAVGAGAVGAGAVDVGATVVGAGRLGVVVTGARAAVVAGTVVAVAVGGGAVGGGDGVEAPAGRQIERPGTSIVSTDESFTASRSARETSAASAMRIQ